jgi:predicted enzyme related to lactoylglutathione lyase
MIGPLSTVTVYVADQQKAVTFYHTALGMEIRRVQAAGPFAKSVELAPPGGGACLMLMPKAAVPNWSELRSSIVFHCKDVQETCRRLESLGVGITMQPTATAWGFFAKFVDLDGNEFGLTSQDTAPPIPGH